MCVCLCVRINYLVEININGHFIYASTYIIMDGYWFCIRNELTYLPPVCERGKSNTLSTLYSVSGKQKDFILLYTSYLNLIQVHNSYLKRRLKLIDLLY